MTLGIIDVGTNSIHLIIGILGLNGTFHVTLKERDLTRLGEGGLARNRLTRAAMRRAYEVLRRYATTVRRCQVDHVEAVATSAVRDAANGRAFVRRVRQRLGLPLRIISGHAEARLIYLGVAQAQRRHQAKLLMSIGGGSAQVMIGARAHLRYRSSVPLGGARLTQRFIRHDPPTSEQIAALTREIELRWRPIAAAIRRHRWHHAVGSSATIGQLMLAAHLRTHRRGPKTKRHLVMSQRSLRALVDWLAGSTASERMRLDGLDPRREDVALPTALVLLGWMKACGVSRLSYAPGSLREGLIVDYLIRHHQRPRRIAAPLADVLAVNGLREVAG